MKRVEHDLRTLRTDLARLGIGGGDVLIVHSSMKSIGWVQGGPRTVIRALQDTLTPTGTLLMPTFSDNFEKVYEPSDPYDPRHSPSRVGLLTETFRRMPGVRRSGHPTHSVAAWGERALEMTEDHTFISGLDAESPFRRAARAGAKVLMIGCGFNRLSLLHVAEELASAPYLEIFNWGYLGWLPTSRLKEKAGDVQVAYPSVPGCSESFGKVQLLAEKKGLLRHGEFGSAPVILFNAEEMLDLTVRQIRRQPDYVLCPPTTCRACDERRTVFELDQSPGARSVGRCIIEIVENVGIRLAGTAGERRAAEWIAGRMGEIGLANVRTQEFPIPAWEPGYSTVQLFLNGTWQTLPSVAGAHAPGTRGRFVEGVLAPIEVMSELDKVPNPHSTIALLMDGYGNSVEEFRRLMARGFKALVMVDKRFADGDLRAAGVPAQWVRRLKRPFCLIPHSHAMRALANGPIPCRLRTGGRTAPGTSQNVIGEIPGREPGAIVVCGHHDSTVNSVAADDNLTGVAMALRIAELLVGERRPRRTIRFISFGSEEMLSEGARWYALESGEADDVRFVLNNDSVGARVGTTSVHITGHPSLAAWTARQIRKSPLPFALQSDVIPFSDQFPFNVLGVPSYWFYRTTTTSGRHFHHTVRDSLAEISFDYLGRLADFQVGLVRQLANGARLPFTAPLPPKLKAQIARAKKEWME